VRQPLPCGETWVPSLTINPALQASARFPLFWDMPERCPACETESVRFFMRAGVHDYWRCDTCEVTFLEPSQRPSRELERATYDLHRNGHADAGYRAFLQQAADPLLPLLPPSSRGLDFGCGPTPLLASLLREAGHEVAVYDPMYFDDTAVLARRYHFITCTEVVEHLHHPAEVFRTLHGLLEPGGWLAIMTSFQTDDSRFEHWGYRRDPTHVVFYREASFHHLARRLGAACVVPRRNVALIRKACSPD
jgi:SAM-dependent methyltransferase